MRLTRNHSAVLFLFVAGAAVAALLNALRLNRANQNPTQRASPAVPHAVASAYADPAVCASCHEEIARSYSLTGMGRSFSKLAPGHAAFAAKAASIYHRPSDRHYAISERDGKLIQRRHQIGFDRKETNALELESHYVIGSGNHARTFVHRAADGRLFQLPVSWYAERQGYWAMSPGYDRPAHLDFRRVIDAGCMSCHNGYPRAQVEHDLDGPRFAEPLPEGIDCQRCHGPGQAHIEAIKRNDLEAALRTIVNPARLDRERQLEACMQCHLETTSAPLPFQVQRYDHPPFSYTPGKALGDFFIHFDHAPGTPSRDDKFEIAGGAYRLRKSACFQRSEMTCVTCHNPHDVSRGPKALERYVTVCQSCHDSPHRGSTPQVRGASSGATCIDCHMPKRRAEDAVHVVMTDHYIQRRRPPGNLVAERKEADSLKHGDYRGEVVLYYPSTLPPGPENDLYLALAQVRQGSNLTAGISRLEQVIETHRPQRPEFHYELARAYSAAGNYEAGIRWSREAVRRDPGFVPALKELGSAATMNGRLSDAADALERAVALRPRDANAFADLGNVYLRQGRVDEAEKTLRRALALDPAMPLANNMMGLAALRKGTVGLAETHLREAIRHQPDLAAAHNNLGNLLAGRKEYAEAAHHFEKAIASNPNYVEARHSYGVVLALMGSHRRAADALQAAVDLAPGLLPARLDLAEVLIAMGRPRDARPHFDAASRSADADVREAALAGLRALR